MTLEFQKRLAADLLKCGLSRVRFDTERLDEIEAAITRAEIQNLINSGAIYKLNKKGVSSGRRFKRRRRGPGSREGAKHSIVPRKTLWISRVRPQRRFLKMLRDKGRISPSDYRRVYLYIKAGNFKSVSALKEFLTSKGLLKEAM